MLKTLAKKRENYVLGHLGPGFLDYEGETRWFMEAIAAYMKENPGDFVMDWNSYEITHHVASSLHDAAREGT